MGCGGNQRDESCLARQGAAGGGNRAPPGAGTTTASSLTQGLSRATGFPALFLHQGPRDSNIVDPVQIFQISVTDIGLSPILSVPCLSCTVIYFPFFFKLPPLLILHKFILKGNFTWPQVENQCHSLEKESTWKTKYRLKDFLQNKRPILFKRKGKQRDVISECIVWPWIRVGESCLRMIPGQLYICIHR